MHFITIVVKSADVGKVWGTLFCSKCSVVTQLTYGEIFNNCFFANCPQNAPVKEFLKRLIFGKDMDKSKVARFLAHPVVSGSVKLFHKFHGHIDRPARALSERGVGKICNF